MSEHWITLNLPLYGMDKEGRDKKLKDLNIKKPSIPNLENKAMKELGFNEESLRKDFYKYGHSLYRIESGSTVNMKNSFISWKNYLNQLSTTRWVTYGDSDSYKLLINNENEIMDIAAKVDKYLNFIENHELTKKYKEKNKDYTENFKKITKEFSWEQNDCNNVGYLIQMYSKKADKYFSYLIGSYSPIKELYRKYYYKDMVIIRAKKLLDESDVVGDLIFE